MTYSPKPDVKHAIPGSLLQPIPSFITLRKLKQGYQDVPIDTTAVLFSEPLVNISAYGIAGQAYYSRPNAITGGPVPEIPRELFLRKSIAETLGILNSALSLPAITQFFQGEVELYIEDALRPIPLQTRLHDVLIPDLLRKQLPKMNEEELALRLRDIIAIPSNDPVRPSPHTTGGAFDITLRYKQLNPYFVANSTLDMGHTDGEVSERINPDYFEYTKIATEDDARAQRNRRAYYAIMTGRGFGMETGFVNNPTEWWHWGRGDQLSARLSNSNSAYYSLAGDDSYEK